MHLVHEISIRMTKILALFNSEDQLVRALKKEDPRAQKKVYDKYCNRMLGLCQRYVGDRMLAEDVLMEGFMKVFDKIDQFKNEGSLEGWIRRIMVNESLGFLRQQKRKPESNPVDDAFQIADVSFADNHLHAAELMELVARLPTGYRTVFNLYAIEGFNHIEIASMLGVTESTSKSQLHRARALLQQQVAELENASKKKITIKQNQL